MISLKAFGPVLAETLGTTPAAIYERQRALVRQGLLPAPVGRGRGNGLPASAGTVAMIIVAMMVTDNLSDTDDRVRRVASAEYLGRRWKRGRAKPRCAQTSKRDSKPALFALVRMTEFPARVRILVSRNYLYSVIWWADSVKERIYESQFGEFGAASNLTVTACLGDGALQSIATALRQASDERSNWPDPMQGDLL